MTLFKKIEKVKAQALYWLLGYFVANLLFLGSIFRIYLSRNLDKSSPEIRQFLGELDIALVYTFWGLLLVAVVFALIFVQVFFNPLGSLITKAKFIKNGELNPKKSDVIKESRGEWYQLDLLLNKIWKDLKRKKDDVAKERGELEALITAATDAILAVDKDMNIRYYNAPMALLLDQKEEGNWGKRLREVVRNQKVIEGFERAFKDKRSQMIETSLELSLDSALHHFKVSVSPFLDEKKNKVRGAVAIFHDISDHKKVEKVRMDFVANASHELKTPLTSIQGYLELIRSTCQNQGELDEAFQVVDSNLYRLNQTIQDLLELSKIESAETVPLTELDTLEVTEEVVMEIQNRFRERSQDLHFRYDQPVVIANPDLLHHVMINLIENASKYCRDSSKIKITWGTSGNYTFLSVKDNGPGIESYHQGRLFERFYRVRDEDNKSVKGTGLGLSIVRNCMQKMNGMVDVKSAPGLGSEFICYFPNKI